MAPKARGIKRKRNEQPEPQVYSAKDKVLVLGDGGKLSDSSKECSLYSRTRCVHKLQTSHSLEASQRIAARASA